MVFCYKVSSIFIIHQDLSFGGFALKIEFVVFVYELINYLFMKLFFITWLCKYYIYLYSYVGPAMVACKYHIPQVTVPPCPNDACTGSRNLTEAAVINRPSIT